MFQPTLRLIGGGNLRGLAGRGGSGGFQPTLRLIGGGNQEDRVRTPGDAVSTHPPPHRRRERVVGVGAARVVVVSTHPPPHRRREHLGRLRDLRLRRVSTHPPPHRRREPVSLPVDWTRNGVSTHPPPHRRRELRRGRTCLDLLMFQPTLRLIGGGNSSCPPSRRCRSRFNPPSASSAEGTQVQARGDRRGGVSTHPPPHRRRERRRFPAMGPGGLFQPTLRLIGGGNPPSQGRHARRGSVSTHPPPHRRREPPSAAPR